ncbi:MAG: hypothetical protein KatS3mg004_1148 [Bryobacteraceae bacterium]|nr:MAG: hypothetical protein KatS3mg004_1148 [Bryobacteraceae bacterium]
MSDNSHKIAPATRVVLCGLVFSAAESISAALVQALGMRMLTPPAGTSPAQLAWTALLASPLLPLALAPLASRLPGALLARTLRLALFTYVSFGLNTMIEARIFTTLVQPGAFAGMCVFYVLPCAALALAVAAAFPARNVQRGPLPERPPAAWAARLVLAWLAFPVIYLLFGAMVAPIVVPAYEQQAAGLVLPPMQVILPTQLLRSLLYLGSALPILLGWAGGWKRLALRLGWAFWVLTGLYGMLTGAWMPVSLRLAHSLEIGADSFVYAFVLAWALRAPSKRAAP